MPTPDLTPSTALSARLRSGSRIGREVAVLGLATAVLALTGCGVPWSGTATADSPTVRPGEMTDAGGQPCPKELPIGDDPSGHGFGVEEAAEELPNLLEPQEAWVCEYNTFDRGTSPGGGSTYGWRLAGQPEPFAPDDLPSLHAALDDLAFVDPGQACTSDLGPRWMVVYTHDGDLTGVVIDDYGCRNVRLTDNPHTTPPGADDQDGTVGGVLNGGAAVLDALGLWSLGLTSITRTMP